MRSDYALYGVAVIFFAITAISYAALTTAFERNLSAVTTTVLGLLFIMLGYTLRPRTRAITVEAPPTPPPPPAPSTTTTETPPTTAESPQIEKTEVIVEPIQMPESPKLELTSVKGVKEKRAAQLKTLGINNVEDLANASAKDLAKKLEISPKFTEKWIEDAKRLLQKS
jgi:predicted flap endonuclease-1-like 5' DNA nuclease